MLSFYGLIFVATLVTAALLVFSKHHHGHFSMDSTFGVQKHHTEPTPRIGGVAIAAGLLAAWFVASAEVRTILTPMLLAGIPAFAFGVAEDVTKRVGVLPRLLATMLSGAVAWYLTGIAMQNTGVAPLDWALAFVPFAVLFTAFAVGGMANAINIIDGFNGLASGSVAIMAAALGVIALQVSDATLATACFTLVAVALGFAAVNWPFGKIFLGDGGAYLLGFMLAWLAILLPMRNPQLNAWVSILVCAYPVLEVAFSVRRRHKREGHHPGHPDRAHLHHFLHRRLVRPALPGVHSTLVNGMTSPLCWLATSLPAAWAIAFADNTAVLALGLGLATFAYAGTYARLTQFAWCFSALTLKRKPVTAHQV
ncbi:MAG: glycosyl transferase [Rhodoferax sp.]|nr:glycosyl transferase [Rhodoferax sp.]